MLTVPPLRARPEDIIPLAEHCLLRSALALKKPVRELTDSAKQVLQAYHYPGNVRELSNLIERAVIFCNGPSLDAAHFPNDVSAAVAPMTVPGVASAAGPAAEADPLMVHVSFKVGERSLTDLEDAIIHAVLERADGNKTLAAKYLGITRWMLDRRRKA